MGALSSHRDITQQHSPLRRSENHKPHIVPKQRSHPPAGQRRQFGNSIRRKFKPALAVSISRLLGSAWTGNAASLLSIWRPAPTPALPSSRSFIHQCFFGINCHFFLCSKQENKIDHSLHHQNLQVWKGFTCAVARSGSCNGAGRISPDMYKQLVIAVNASYALDHYTPLLLSLQDCKFVRETFNSITSNHCSYLERYLRMVDAGLVLISIGVILCLFLWTLYANRRRREVPGTLSEVLQVCSLRA